MAREAGGRAQANQNCDDEYLMSVEQLKAFEALVRADEREACAKVCDEFERAKWESVKNITENGGRLAFAGPMHCAAAIRARGNT
jgi:hypothetical protein